jgi:hypothetical protein
MGVVSGEADAVEQRKKRPNVYHHSPDAVFDAKRARTENERLQSSFLNSVFCFRPTKTRMARFQCRKVGDFLRFCQTPPYHFAALTQDRSVLSSACLVFDPQERECSTASRRVGNPRQNGNAISIVLWSESVHHEIAILLRVNLGILNKKIFYRMGSC